jgi:Zn-dependent metalloprotease
MKRISIRWSAVVGFAVAAAVMALAVAASGAAPGRVGVVPLGDPSAGARVSAAPVLLSARAVRSRLQPLSNTRVSVIRDAAGVVRWLSGSFGSDLERGAVDSPIESAYRFLVENGAVLGLALPRAEFVAPRTVKDRFGAQHVYFTQRLNGVAVLNGGIAVHFDRTGRITVVDGGYVPSAVASVASVRAEVPAASAVWTAVQRVRRTPDCLDGGVTDALGASITQARATVRFPYARSTLRVAGHRAGYWAAADGSAHLAWQFGLSADQPSGEWSVTVDAHSGRVLDAHSDLRTSAYGARVGKGRDLFNRKVTVQVYRDPSGGLLKLIDTSKHMRRHHSSNHPFTLWQGAIEVRTSGNRVNRIGDPIESSRFPTVSKKAGSNLFTDRAAVSLARDFSLTYDTYLRVFKRNSLNGLGVSVVGNVHLGRQYENAYWSPERKMMFFGDNDPSSGAAFPRSLDVVAHEFTHGVTNYSVREGGAPHGFTYLGQAGAVDEGYSDVFACIVDWDDWTIGEDLGAPMRDLSDPKKYDQPASMFDFYSMPLEIDNGGVHYDNSLISHADYLMVKAMADAGMAERDARDAVGWVYYQAYRYLDGNPDASLQLAGNALLQAAHDIDAARGDGQATMQQLAANALGGNGVGVLDASVLQYDDGSVVASDGSIDSQRFNGLTPDRYPTSYAAVRFDGSAAGGLRTIQLGLWSSDISPAIPDGFKVWLTPCDASGQPVGDVAQWQQVYPGPVPVTPRYDGVFTNLTLPEGRLMHDPFCVVVLYTNTPGQTQFPELMADSGQTATGRSWMAASVDGGATYQWRSTTELFGAPYNWLIRVIWDATAP